MDTADARVGDVADSERVFLPVGDVHDLALVRGSRTLTAFGSPAAEEYFRSFVTRSVEVARAGAGGGAS